MQDFRSLKVWERAHSFALEVYRVTKGFPSDERYGLTDQLRRAASSVAANIAEGCGRDGAKDMARFLTMAAGSASEAEYRLLLARDLGYLTPDTHVPMEASAKEIRKMLYVLRTKVLA